MTSTERCREMELLIQADIDGELDAAAAAGVVAHRQQCAHCMAIYQQLTQLRQSLRAELTRHTAAPEFRVMLEAKIANEIKNSNAAAPNSIIANTIVPGPTAPSSTVSNINKKSARPAGRWRPAVGFGGMGAALAASLLLFLARPAEPLLVDAVVAEHIRALQPGHLMDVVSNDQHNVKPWFDGKLDFAPTVKNLAPQGFPLAGGRLDYLDGRPVAALVYQRAKHPINLFVWPDRELGKVTTEPKLQIRNGYNAYHWQQNNMQFWAVSDLNESELLDFVNNWRSVDL